ncbi:MAG TPA: hypothetical protein DCS29_03795 [Candidatus Magasanikbacteria bacterium]|nr:hypothetical protein [Candidatus Magasanikbacteria bacterium]
MKICIINNLYPPYARGGAEQVVKRTVDGLLKQGNDVVLITSTPDDEGVEEQVHLKIYRIRPRNIFFYTQAHKHDIASRFLWHIIDMFNVFVSRETKRILTWEKPDIVHTHNLMGLSFLIPQTIRALGIRHVHTVHDVQLVEPSGIILKTRENSWRYTGFPTKLYTWIMKKLLGSPEVVISPSQFLLDFYKARGFFRNSAKTLLRNPLTLDFKEEKGERVSTETFNFLYLGQVEDHKGIFLLGEAFEKISDAVLHIVGDGSRLENLKEYTKGNKHVVYHGRVDREKLPELFSMMDVTVVPSLCYENSPTVIFESLYFGVPVLASRIEGIAELIEEGENGFTFEAGDVSSLIHKLSWCVEHKKEIDSMRIKIPTTSRSEGEYIEKLITLYSKSV